MSAVRQRAHSGASVNAYVPPARKYPGQPGTAPITGISSGVAASGPAHIRSSRSRDRNGRIRAASARLPRRLATEAALRPSRSSVRAGQPPPPGSGPRATCLTERPWPMCCTTQSMTGGTRTVMCIWIATGFIASSIPDSAATEEIHGPARFTSTGADHRAGRRHQVAGALPGDAGDRGERVDRRRRAARQHRDRRWSPAADWRSRPRRTSRPARRPGDNSGNAAPGRLAVHDLGAQAGRDLKPVLTAQLGCLVRSLGDHEAAASPQLDRLLKVVLDRAPVLRRPHLERQQPADVDGDDLAGPPRVNGLDMKVARGRS